MNQSTRTIKSLRESVKSLQGNASEMIRAGRADKTIQRRLDTLLWDMVLEETAKREHKTFAQICEELPVTNA